jgi:phosphoglycerol transferase MdoB-like AlkP superfamily enzyme
MELLTPQFGLLFWTLLSGVDLLLTIFALIKLRQNQTLSSGSKLSWFFIIAFVPFAGAIIYLNVCKGDKFLS